MRTIYRGLPQFGLPFITRDDPEFSELASQISLDPFSAGPEEPPAQAVVVLNGSGKAVLAMSVLSKWADKNGQISEQRIAGLHSLDQLNWSAERADPRRTWFHPFLAGSKRLITPQGIFGDNSDVLPPEMRPSGFMGSAKGFNGRTGAQDERFLTELQLDSVIFSDGLCAGPDEMGMLASIGSIAAEQRRIASEAVNLLRSGASAGELFEVVRSAARHPGPHLSPQKIADPPHLLFSFGRQAVDHLVNMEEERREPLLAWFRSQSESPVLKLRRSD